MCHGEDGRFTVRVILKVDERLEASLLSVGADPVVVERQLRLGALRCPQCTQPLAPWGHAALRLVRQATAVVEGIRPRREIRSSSAGCGRSHEHTSRPSSGAVVQSLS